MNIKGLVHVNINCSDFDLSLKFYELLGFQKVLEVPEKNTPEVAAAVGMPLIIDLLEWREPTDSNPPYPHLYHLGIARIALATDDLDSDVAFLKSHGVEFLSEPVKVKIGDQPESRFVCFKDPDGTILELVE